MDTIRGPGGKLRLHPESSEAKRRGAMLDQMDKQIADDGYNRERRVTCDIENAVDKDFCDRGIRMGKSFSVSAGFAPTIVNGKIVSE